LSGLTRVRRFHQDDAHIFCSQEQILPEISSCLQFVEQVYTAFQFQQYDFTLSTRPKEGYIGTPEVWSTAESALQKALDATGKPWTIKEGDGAFYGPKIDIMIRDSAGRSHQTATIQLDFQLPHRFNLRYADENDTIQTPVIIHRAILGSIERMMAILIEHTGGKWPFWLSPRQGIVIPVATQFMDYAQEAASVLGGKTSNVPHYYVDADTSPRDRLNKMIRRAQLNQYNYIFVVGQKELDEQTVNVRTRKGEVLGTMTLDQVRAMFAEDTDKKQ
jgi:threonyl-tRNA synthetase